MNIAIARMDRGRASDHSSHVLYGVAEDYKRDGRDLLKRWHSYSEWLEARLAAGVEPYSKATTSRVGPGGTGQLRNGLPLNGVNFASQDYLNLSTHPRIHAAAKAAIDRYGVHSAGSVALMGNSTLSLELERRLAGFLGYRDCTVFPTGWGAGYGLIRTLVRPDDHVVIDMLAHASLQEGAGNATRNVHRVPHCSNHAVLRRLQRIRKTNADCGILVVTETLFSMDSDVPDIAELQDICSAHGATLMVDVAHDLGAIGPTGRGFLEIQGMIGKVDVVMGSFSKTFAANGGFVACQDPALKLALRYNCGPLLFTNALSPVQAGIVLAALDIVEGPEGGERRARLMGNSMRLRCGLEAAGFTLLGQPSAIVPVILGDNAFSRLATRYALAAGSIVNLVEHPAVSRNSCRWRLQMMADHTDGQIDLLLAIAGRARDVAHAERAAIRANPLAAEPAG